MNKKLIIILTVSVACSLVIGLLVGYFIPSSNTETNSLQNNTSNSSLISGKKLYITNSDTFKQSKTYTTDKREGDKSNKQKFPGADPKKVKITPNSSDELTKNIEVIDIVYNETSYNGVLQIHAKNNNSKSVAIDFMLEFYDSTGKKISSSFGHPGTFTFPNTEFAVSLSFTPLGVYSSYEIKYEAKEVDSKHQSFDELKDTKYYIVQEGDGSMDVLFKNQTNHDISGVCFSFLLYKDGKLVWADSSINKDADEMTPDTGNIIHAYVNLYNNVEYDEAKVIFTGAYKLNKQG